MYIIINKVPINLMRCDISAVKRMSLSDLTNDMNQMKNNFYNLEDYFNLEDESNHFFMSYLKDNKGELPELIETNALNATYANVARYIFSINDDFNKVYSKFYNTAEEAQEELEKFIEIYNSYTSKIPRIEI